jgi:hypothetical protein
VDWAAVRRVVPLCKRAIIVVARCLKDPIAGLIRGAKQRCNRNALRIDRIAGRIDLVIYAALEVELIEQRLFLDVRQRRNNPTV